MVQPAKHTNQTPETTNPSKGDHFVLFSFSSGALTATVNYFFFIIIITPVKPHSHLPKENIIPIAAFSILLL